MEFVNVLKDIAAGNLPLSELPGFFFFMLARSFWFWFFLAAGITIGIFIGR